MEQLNKLIKLITEGETEPWSILHDYALMIHSENQKYNLTGHKTFELILSDLIARSAEQFENISVPRGTLIADIGSGAGIPGLVVAAMNPFLQVACIDSTAKKTEFISHAAEKLGMTNVSSICARAEELGKNSLYREKYHGIITRAMAHPFGALELAAPLAKIGGFVFLSANRPGGEEYLITAEHGKKLGLDEAQGSEMQQLGFHNDGMLFIKRRKTPPVYPRTFAAIKRNVDSIRGIER